MKATFGAFSWVRAVGAFSLFLVLFWGNGFAQSGYTPPGGWNVVDLGNYNGNCEDIGTFCNAVSGNGNCCNGNTLAAATATNANSRCTATQTNNVPWQNWAQGRCFRFVRGTTSHAYEAQAYVVKDGDLITGTSSVGIVVNRSGIRFAIENLRITGSDMTVPISIGQLNINAGTTDDITNTTNPNTGGVWNNRPRNVTMYVKGENFLVAGSGSAAIRVPTGSALTIENGETDGSVGVLNAIGGSSHASSNAPAGAGIGSGFAYTGLGMNSNNFSTDAMTNINGANDISNNDRIENCGDVTINGGKIYAAGSKGYIGYMNALGGHSPGIGGYNQACNSLTINGGTVTAIGGNPGVDDIGAGQGNITSVTSSGGINPTRTYNPYVCNSITTSRTTIKGGSVKVGNSTNSGICGGARNGSATNLSKFTFTVGNANSTGTGNKEVHDCSFTATNNDEISCTKEVPANNEQYRYGINSVYTDANGIVYFWLPTPILPQTNPQYSGTKSGSDGDNIYLNGIVVNSQVNPDPQKYYLGAAVDASTRTGRFVSGTLPPSMRYPADYPSAFVCDSEGMPYDSDRKPEENCDATAFELRKLGAYATGFRMAGYQHVAAVGHQVQVNIGTYLPNDAGSEATGTSRTDRVHLVRWYRSADNKCDLSAATTTLINQTLAPEIGENGFISGNSSHLSDKYTPDLKDYGRYICAAVLVKDNGNPGYPNDADIGSNTYWATQSKINNGNVVVYPSIKVGVVVRTDIVVQAESVSGVPVSEVYQSLRTLDANLVTEWKNSYTGLEIPLNVMAAIVPASNKIYDYTWSTNGYPGKFNLDGSRVSILPTRNGIGDYYLPEPCEEFLPPLQDLGNCNEATVPNGDITLMVTISDVTNQPKLSLIEFCKDDGCDNTVLAAIVVDATTNIARDTDIPMPVNGFIRLTFDSPIFDAKSTGDIFFNPEAKRPELVMGSAEQGQQFTYQYWDLAPGTTYILDVRNFDNGKLPMLRTTTTFTTEQRAMPGPLNYTVVNFVNTDNFIIGSTISTTVSYTLNQSGNLTEACYYLEVSDDMDGKLFDETECEKNKISGVGILNYTTVPVSYILDDKDLFGKFVRLVVRPKGTNEVNGDPYGEVAYGAIKPVGILLQSSLLKTDPITVDEDYSGVAFKGCSPEAPDAGILGNFKGVGISGTGCLSDKTGYFTFLSGEDIRLTAVLKEPTIDGIKQYKKIDDWTATGNGFNPHNECRKYEPPTNPAPTTEGINCYQTVSNYITGKDNIPSDGVIYFTPNVIPWTVPKVSRLEMTQLVIDENGNMEAEVRVNLKGKEEGNIAVIGTDDNDLVLEFDNAIHGFTDGTIALYKGGSYVKPLGCDWKGSSTSCSIKLTDIFGTEIKEISESFDESFRILVAGFKDAAGERMDTEQFYFTAVAGPSVKKVSIRDDIRGLEAREAVAIGQEFIAIGGSNDEGATIPLEFVNGGGASCKEENNECVYNYKWQIQGANNDVATTKKYTPTADDWQKNIRVGVAAVDEHGNVGKYVYSSWLQVGVRVYANYDGVDYNGIEDHDYEMRIGIADYETSRSLGVIVLGATPIRIISKHPTDAFEKWEITTATGGDIPNQQQTTNLEFPSAPIGPIYIKGYMRDGIPPNVWAAQSGSGGSGLVFTFSKDVTPIAGKTITIKSGNTEWTYILKDSDIPERSGESIALNLATSEFKNGTESFAIVGGAEYIVGIEDKAFKDNSKNYTAENPRLLVFYGGGTSYAARSSVYYITKQVEYGSVALNESVEIENLSTSGIDFVARLDNTGSPFLINDNAGAEFFAIEQFDKFDFAITANSEQLDAKEYKEVLSIEGFENGVKKIDNIKIELTLIVKPKVITIPSETKARFEIENGKTRATKIYDGFKDSPGIVGMLTWSGWFGEASFDTRGTDINVVVSKGNYGDEHVGTNKPVDIIYEITGTKASNYTFRDNDILHKYEDSDYGDITQRPIGVEFSKLYDPNDLIVGDKPYDGKYTLPAKVDNDYRLKLVDDDVANRDQFFGRLALDIEEASFMLKSPNAGAHDITSISGAFLTGDWASNYKLNPVPADIGSRKGKINGASLCEHLKVDKVTAEVAIPCDVTAKYAVKAATSYGAFLNATLSWEEPPKGSITDEEGQPVPGDWKFCLDANNAQQPDVVCNNWAGQRVSDVKDYRALAYFDAASDNYEKDIFAWFEAGENLSVSKRTLIIEEELAGAGDLFNGIKTYDGTDTLGGVAFKRISNLTPLIFGTDAVTLEVDNAKFDDPNAGIRSLTIKWSAQGDTAKYEPLDTKTIGSIAKRTVYLTNIKVNDKFYDGTTNVTLPDDALSAIGKGNIVSGEENLVGFGSVILANVQDSAKFTSPNVSWNGTHETEVSVAFGANITLSGTAAGNYTPQIAQSSAIIKQIDLPNSNVALTQNLRSQGIYGSRLGDVIISTSVDTTGSKFPRSLYGIDIPGKGVETVLGIWSWDTLTHNIMDYVGDATAIGQTSCGTGNTYYSARKTVVFEGQNYNYKPLYEVIPFCVLPRRIEMPDPYNFAAKVYDGTRIYRHFDSNGIDIGFRGIEPGVTSTSPLAAGTIIDIDTAFYGSSEAGNNQNITVRYRISGDLAFNHLPPLDKVQQSMTISKRPISIKDLIVGDKYYDGTPILSSPVIGTPRLQCANESGAYSAVRCASDLVAGDSGVVVGQTVVLDKNEPIEWQFYSPNAGEQSVVPNEGAFSISGSAAHNYELILTALRANIHQFSLAHYLCEEFTSEANCATFGKKQKEDLINANLAKAAEILMDGRGPVEAYHGDTLVENLTNKLRDIMPKNLGELFGIKIGDELDPTPVLWNWTYNRVVRGAGTPDADNVFFTVTNPNYDGSMDVPIPININKRPLWLTALNPVSRDYDTTNIVSISYNINNVAYGDNLSNAISVIGFMEDANAGTGKSIQNVSAVWITDDSNIMNNYELLDINAADAGEVNIAKIEWPGFAADPIATPAEFVYDTIAYPSLSTDYIGLSLGWDWAPSIKGNAIANPHSANTPFITEEYEVAFAPPEEYSVNYYGKPGTVTLKINKRNENNDKDTAFITAECGADNARITVKALNQYATIWSNGYQYGNSNEGSFMVGSLADYKKHKIYYGIQAQAYGPEYYKPDSIEYIRYVPFDKVAYWIREKTLAVNINLDSNESYLSKFSFNLPKTKWFDGSEFLGEGRSMAVSRTDGDYSLILTTTTGEEFASCKDRGGFPEVTPINKERKINLIASSFGSRVVMGGTNLEFNTPFGGIVSIYTLKGELVSKMNAVDTRTVVKIPSAHGMYIVKLEAKK